MYESKKTKNTTNVGLREYATQKGITLIALIITIIILLILSGITINLTLGENGLFNTAKQATEEYTKSQLKEELELAIVNIQTKKIEQGLEFTRADLTELASVGATMESTGIPAEGEYKDYFFEVDENYIVTIIGKLKGEKPTINAEIITQGIVAQGGKVEIKVTAGISEGTITNIEATNGAVLKEDAQTSDGEKIYEVTENGIYYFKATADNGRSAVVEVKVDLIEIGSNMTVQVGSDITVQAPAGWIVVSSYLNDLPLSKYSKVKITFSFTAGYDWAFYFVTDDGDEYAFDGSHIYGHVSVPTTTKIYDIPKDKNYTKIRFASSSLNAIVQVDEVYLIK